MVLLLCHWDDKEAHMGVLCLLGFIVVVILFFVVKYGHRTKIYHLPFDQQYDATKINSAGEFMATTIAEAENAGFRRAHKWFGK